MGAYQKRSFMNTPLLYLKVHHQIGKLWVYFSTVGIHR